MLAGLWWAYLCNECNVMNDIKENEKAENRRAEKRRITEK